MIKKLTLITTLTATLLFTNVLYAQTLTSTAHYEHMATTKLIEEASNNNHHAQFFLAKRLQKGEGVAKDADKAVYWYTRAAEKDIAPAQLNLGIMYLRGEGVEADMDTGRKWLERAAHLGDNRASYALAMIDEKQHRLIDAYKWYDLSSRDGMLDQNIKHKAQAKIGQLALNLSSSDIERAKMNADDWFIINHDE